MLEVLIRTLADFRSVCSLCVWTSRTSTVLHNPAANEVCGVQKARISCDALKEESEL